MRRLKIPGLGVGLCLLAALATPVSAQDTDDGEPRPLFSPAHDVYDRGGFAYVFVGLSFFDMDGINGVLSQLGYQPITDGFFTYGTGGFVTFEHFLLGLEFYDTFSNTSELGVNQANFDGGYWAAHFAYLFNLGPIHIYPVVGAGWASFRLELLEGPADFGRVVTERPSQLIFEASGPLLQLAVGAEYLIPTSRDEQSVTGLLLGLRAGYFVEPLGLDWTVSGADSAGAPELGIGVPYLSLVGGFGSWRVSAQGIPFLEP